MTIQLRCQLSLKFIVLFNIAIFTITACSAQSPPELEAVSSNCHIVKHAMGATCVPFNPQRVAIWGGTELDPVLALAVKPIAGRPNILSYVKEKLPAEQWRGIADINSPQGPNLEHLLELKPDLILGHQSRIAQVYPQLSKIAPTVLGGSDNWKTTFRLFAEALGKTDEAQQILKNYQARIRRFKAEMGDRLPMTVAIVEVRPDVLITYTKDTFPIQILSEAGLSLPSALEKYTWRSWALSRERLDEIDADVIFISTWRGSQQDNQAVQAVLEKLTSDPLWLKLNAIQQDKVYTIGDYIQGGGPLTANLILDDLFAYLLN